MSLENLVNFHYLPLTCRIFFISFSNVVKLFLTPCFFLILYTETVSNLKKIAIEGEVVELLFFANTLRGINNVFVVSLNFIIQ